MGAALALTALLLSHQRLADAGANKTIPISVLLTMAMGLVMGYAHFVIGPLIRNWVVP